METTHTEPRKHIGSCHCGAVRFEVEVDARTATRCNCRICTKIGPTGAIVKPEAFTLTAGESALSTYGNSIGARYFCRTCGVHCYGTGHLAELGGDFVSINLNTLDDIDLRDVSIMYWDGRHDNWQAGPRDTPWPIHASA